MTGKRGGGGDDSGIGGRIYGMLAKEMSDTANRGKIIWVFATSRPDLIEVDLKRPGRLDVHIPLFPPQTVEEKQALFLSMGGKVGLPLTVADLPDIPAQLELGGNEVETLVVRTLRLRGADNTGSLRDTLQAVLESYRPSAHHAMLEFMDLIATRECTDQTFLPAKFQGIDQSMLETRINQLQSELNLR
jgi:SpoVK/Ycf46/Vps4 family AAA+-type ATPase